MNNKNIKVTVCCTTYNHEKYIRKALNGFVMQKTDFPFKVIVHDDASTDNTAEIIKEYAEKYPDIIKPILQTENQYSKNPDAIYDYINPLIEGEYIALCEGDDYWIDEYKLQKQVTAMDSHQEIDMCVHGSLHHYVINDSYSPSPFNKDRNCIISQRETIFAGGGFVATSSILYRSKLINNIPKFCEYFSTDYFWQIYGSLRGGLLYLKDVMSVYNRGVENSYSGRFFGECKEHTKHFIETFKALNILNKETNYKYCLTIKLKILQLKKRIVKMFGIKKIKEENYEFYRSINFVTLLIIYILIFISNIKDKLVNKSSA